LAAPSLSGPDVRIPARRHSGNAHRFRAASIIKCLAMVRDGYLYALGLLIIAALIYFSTGSWIWAAIPILLAVFFLWFFRDPRRTVPEGEGLIVSPADGKVTIVERITTPAGDRLRLSIFLSVFDVHVNRAPVGGVIRRSTYKKGKYLNALNPASAVENEQQLIEMESEDGFHVSFKLIAGLLARRIVFQRKEGDLLARGERVGLIKFGSRVDVMLPVRAELAVRVGDRVKGGFSVLARVAEVAGDTLPADVAVEVLV
jgi:phosphatidylserine decarboxylase